jgi:Sigma-70, region 4
MTLEEELIGIFVSTANKRNAKILIGYYGWKDGRQRTLTEIGDRFGLTRERVRQICAKLTRRPGGVPRTVVPQITRLRPPIAAPVMDRALKLIHSRLPGPAAEIEAELCRRGWTKIGMPLENVATAAKLLGRKVDFRLIQIVAGQDVPLLAVRPEQVNERVDGGRAIFDAAKKNLSFHGLTTIDEVVRTMEAKGTGPRSPRGAAHELATETLQMAEGFSWLDRKSGWFRIEGLGKRGLPTLVDKVLAVAGKVHIADLRTAMLRMGTRRAGMPPTFQLWRTPPPDDVLLEFCRRLPGVRVVGEYIAANPRRDWRKVLTGVELKLVSALKRHGPIMERDRLEDLCLADGMNPFSFRSFVCWSPVIMQFGNNVYGLLGSKVGRQELDAMTANAHRVRHTARRVLVRHGRTGDGKVWLRYRLSKAASTRGLVTIPVALKKRLRGQYVLFGPDGQSIGTLTIKEERASGLGPFLRNHGADVDDGILLTLDLAARTATVNWTE